MNRFSAKPIPLTIGILTHNSEATLERALRSVAGAGDIVICDGSSTDKTREIATVYGARVMSQSPEYLYPDGRIKDFSGVRNQILYSAKYSWVFFLDSDEEATPSLLDEMNRIITQNEAAAYYVDRRYISNGREILYATTYPNKQMRFFHKDAVIGYVRLVHERPKIRPGFKVFTTTHRMLVPIEEDLRTVWMRWNRYIEMEAALHPRLTFKKWLTILAHHLKVSTLYLIRFLCIVWRSNKNRLSTRYELARHCYHAKLMRRLWANIEFVQH